MDFYLEHNREGNSRLLSLLRVSLFVIIIVRLYTHVYQFYFCRYFGKLLLLFAIYELITQP